MKHLIIKFALVSSFLLPIPAVASGTRSISTSDARGINDKTIQLFYHPGSDLTMDSLDVDEIIVDGSLVASGTRSISTSDAQGTNGKTLQLLIHSGYGLTMDFLELDEIILDASLADPSNFTFSGLVGNLCPKFVQAAQCDGNGARGIRIRRMSNPIKFPNISSSPDGRTTLTLVTQGRDGLKVYKFILKKGQGVPSFDHVKVTPDPEKLPINLSTESLSPEELDEARARWENLTNKNREVELKYNE